MAGAKATERCLEAFDEQIDYLFTSLRLLGAQRSEIEDLAHQVFLLFLRRWRTLGERPVLRHELFRLAVRVVARRRRRTTTDTAGALPESQSLILSALDRVPVRRRAVLILHDIEQATLAEVARGLSMTELGVRTKLRKARLELEGGLRRLAADRMSVANGPDALLAELGRRAEELDAFQPAPPVALSQLRVDVILLEMLMDEVPRCIYFKDRESRFTRINPYAAFHYGIASPALAVGCTDFDFFTSEHAVQALHDEQEIIRTGRPLVSIEEKETLPDGKLRWVSTTKLPLLDRDGGIVGTFGLSRDLSSQLEPRAAS